MVWQVAHVGPHVGAGVKKTSHRVLLDVAAEVWQSYGFEETKDDQFLQEVYEEVEQFCASLKIQASEVKRLKQQPDAGIAALIDPANKNTLLMSLFLTKKGYSVEKLSDLSGFFDREQPAKLCLLRPVSPRGAQSAVAELESKGGGKLPTVCLLPEGMTVPELGEAKSWLRAVTTPVDCFELSCKIDELLEPGEQESPKAEAA